MQRKQFSINLALFLTVLIMVLFVTSATAFGAARIVLVNKDKPGVGFNDPTPAAPVGANKGATVGEQRRIAVQYALDIWGAALESNAEIRVQAKFEPLPCTASYAVLGTAGAIDAIRDFPGAEFPNTWYPIALANKRAGHDLSPDKDDIIIYLNSSLGSANPDGSPCLSREESWYYGLDTDQSDYQSNLVAVILHELTHGLGSTFLMDLNSGARFLGSDDIYFKYIFDTILGKRWDQMTDAERQVSMVNARRVVWDGPHVKAAVPAVLSRGMPKLAVNSPGDIKGDYVADGAEFNPPLSAPLATGNIVLTVDGAGVASDACSPLTNAQAVRGNIALVDRGTCYFTDKVKNAQDAGAIGVIVADNLANSYPFRMRGEDPAIRIRSVMISLANGSRIKAVLKSMAVTATMGNDPAIFAGADSSGRALLYTPNPVSRGASVAHWDQVAFPDQMMEPYIPQYIHSVKEPEDLTAALMKDLGWGTKSGGGGNPVTSVSAASYTDGLASEAIAAAFGTRLATTTLEPTEGQVLPTQLGGTRVLVRDSGGTERAAPLFFVSPTQVNYQIPPGTTAGPASVTVTSGDGTVSAGMAQIALLAPGVFTANGDGQGVPKAVTLHVKGGDQRFETVFQYDSAQRRFVPRPVDLGEADDQVFLILFGTGLRHYQNLSAVSARIGGVDAPVLWVGRDLSFVGVDQVNMRLPRSLLGRGEVDVVLMVGGKTANTVRINIR